LVPVSETLLTAERGPVESGPAGPPVAPRVFARNRAAFWRLLGSELGLTFRRPRNIVMLAVLAAVPVVMGVALRVIAGDDGMGGIIGDVAGNGLMLTFVSLSILVILLLPVAVSVVAGDSIAGEAGAGTLRYLLAAPAGRTRLLAVKYLNAVVFSVAATALVAVAALVTGLILFPTGPVTLLSGTTVPVGDALLRVLISVGYVSAGMAALAAVALAFSTFTEVSIGAIAATVVVLIVTQVLRAIPQLAPLNDYLLPSWWSRFDGVLRSPIDTGAMAQGLLAYGAYILLFLSIGWARFTGKDITS
jgi:ABC-2 type transport system permease protein